MCGTVAGKHVCVSEQSHEEAWVFVEDTVTVAVVGDQPNDGWQLRG